MMEFLCKVHIIPHDFLLTILLCLRNFIHFRTFHLRFVSSLDDFLLKVLLLLSLLRNLSYYRSNQTRLGRFLVIYSFGQRPILVVLLLQYLLLVDFTFVIDYRLLRLFIHLLVTQHSYELTQ